VVAEERQALGQARAPEREVVSAGTEEELVLDVPGGQRFVDVLHVVLQGEVVFGAAIEVQRDLARSELVDERDDIVGLPGRDVGADRSEPELVGGGIEPAALTQLVSFPPRPCR
jgi:hypothetical protein